MREPGKPVACIEMEDFLALEHASRHKHQYLDGATYAIQGQALRSMTGGSQAHSRLIRNMGFALHAKLRGSPCGVLSTEMRLRVAAVGALFYPALLAHCQPTPDPAAKLELTDARLVVEVLSPSTERFDRGDKLAACMRLPRLQHIVLLSGPV